MKCLNHNDILKNHVPPSIGNRVSGRDNYWHKQEQVDSREQVGLAI